MNNSTKLLTLAGKFAELEKRNDEDSSVYKFDQYLTANGAEIINSLGGFKQIIKLSLTHPDWHNNEDHAGRLQNGGISAGCEGCVHWQVRQLPTASLCQ